MSFHFCDDVARWRCTQTKCYFRCGASKASLTDVFAVLSVHPISARRGCWRLKRTWRFLVEIPADMGRARKLNQRDRRSAGNDVSRLRHVIVHVTDVTRNFRAPPVPFRRDTVSFSSGFSETVIDYIPLRKSPHYRQVRVSPREPRI